MPLLPGLPAIPYRLPSADALSSHKMRPTGWGLKHGDTQRHLGCSGGFSSSEDFCSEGFCCCGGGGGGGCCFGLGLKIWSKICSSGLAGFGFVCGCPLGCAGCVDPEPAAGSVCGSPAGAVCGG